MNLSPTAQATMLLTCYFSKASNENVKPLTITEWGRFALWLRQKNITPSELLVSNPENLLADWHDNRMGVERILALLGRGHGLALAVEKWTRAGLWVMTRSDPEYPKLLKERLQNGSPPVLFGCGNKLLLGADKKRIAVVGSRNANAGDLCFAKNLGGKAATEGISVVSGGARGIDESAMFGAISAGGSIIGVIADNLLKAATSAKWREGIKDDHVLLLSPFYPESGFSRGNAMARNKYIYCLSDTSVVVCSGKTGGTVNGAVENLKKNWIPLYVKPTEDMNTANDELVSKGGRKLSSTSAESICVSELFSTITIEKTLQQKQVGLFQKTHDSPDYVSGRSAEIHEQEKVRVQETSDSAYSKPVLVDFYELFLEGLAKVAINPISVEELVEKTKLHKSQIKEWLNRAVGEQRMKKLARPVRYQYIKRED